MAKAINVNTFVEGQREFTFGIMIARKIRV